MYDERLIIPEVLWCRLCIGQYHSKDCLVYVTCGRYPSTVGFNDLFRNGKPKPCAACMGRTGGIQTEKLLEYPLQFFSRDGVTLIGKRDNSIVMLAKSCNRNGGVIIAVRDGILQDIVEHTRELIRIAPNDQIIRSQYGRCFVLWRKDRIKLICHLAQHQGKVDSGLVDFDMLEIKPGDFEKLINELIQTVRFLQCYPEYLAFCSGGISGASLRRLRYPITEVSGVLIS